MNLFSKRSGFEFWTFKGWQVGKQIFCAVISGAVFLRSKSNSSSSFLFSMTPYVEVLPQIIKLRTFQMPSEEINTSLKFGKVNMKNLTWSAHFSGKLWILPVISSYPKRVFHPETMEDNPELFPDRSYQDNEQHRIDERKGLFQTRESTMNRVDCCIMMKVGTVIVLNKFTDILRKLTLSSCRLIFMC